MQVACEKAIRGDLNRKNPIGPREYYITINLLKNCFRTQDEVHNKRESSSRETC